MTASNTQRRAEYQIRRPEPEDREGIHQLFELSLDSSRDRRFWHWKHVDNPFGETYWLVAEAEGEIVGARAFMQWEWLAQGRRFRAVRAVDTATHPDWRRKGIFTNLTREMIEEVEADGVDFIFNTPNQASRPGYLKMGWEVVDKIPIWVRPLRPVEILQKLLGGGSKPSTGGVQYGDTNIAELLATIEAAAVFDSAYRGETRCHTNRWRDYLRWRYLDIPDMNYHATWRREGDAAAFVIHRRRCRGGLVEVMLCELAATAGSTGVALLRKLLGELVDDSNADYMIGCAARNSTEMWALATSGFIWIPKIGPTLVWRPVSSDSAALELGRWPQWRCSIGDLEIF